MQELPFPGQTDQDIEQTFSSAQAQISYKMDTNGFLEFIKDDKLNSPCNPYDTLRWGYYSEDEFIRKINKCNQTLNIISFYILSLPRHSGELLVFLEALEIHFHGIVLSEIGARNIGAVENLLSNHEF